MQVEGIPEGWELVRVGKCFPGDVRVAADGNPEEWNSVSSIGVNYVIIRKIEKPKRYRPFANAAEFEPHRDKWIKRKSGNVDHRIKTHSYNNLKHYTGDVGDTWQTMLDDYEFEDGTPLGVEVTE